jgi:hypothetical protein
MNNDSALLKLGCSEGLSGCYAELSGLWRAAARAYAERASRASSITKNTDPDGPWSWDAAAVRASLRAARYARLAEGAK